MSQIVLCRVQQGWGLVIRKFISLDSSNVACRNWLGIVVTWYKYKPQGIVKICINQYNNKTLPFTLSATLPFYFSRQLLFELDRGRLTFERLGPIGEFSLLNILDFGLGAHCCFLIQVFDNYRLIGCSIRAHHCYFV